MFPIARCASVPILLLISILLAAHSVQAQHPDKKFEQRTIHVTGQGSASAPPDMATIQTGVITQAPDAKQALAANNQAMAQLMEVLKQHGIADKHIQTSNFQVHPQYEHNPRGNRKPEIVGYQVNNEVRVEIHNLPKLGEVLDALVQAGSNQVSNISFGIDDERGLMDQARNRAVADARRRAELFAHAAGVRLGKVLSISEQTFAVPMPQRRMQYAAAEMARAVPIATGEQELQTNVSMIFELKDAD